jgi:lipopolysaccharide transport system permease protein
MLFKFIQTNNIKAGLALFKRELIVSRQKSPLSTFWDILEPFILAIFFILLYQRKVFTVPNVGMSYGLYVAFGMLLWQSFLEALTKPILIFDQYSNLFAHVKINNGVILYSLIFSLLYSLGCRVFILLIVLIYYQSFVFSNALIFILLSGFVIIPGISLGFFLAAFGPFREDIKRFITLISRPLMFLSCTIFPMPETGILTLVDSLNPAAVFINNIRYMAVQGEFYNFEVFVIWFILFSMLFLSAWKLFKFVVKYLVDRS